MREVAVPGVAMTLVRYLREDQPAERATRMGTPLATRTFAMASQAQHESSILITFPSEMPTG